MMTQDEEDLLYSRLIWAAVTAYGGKAVCVSLMQAPPAFQHTGPYDPRDIDVAIRTALESSDDADIVRLLGRGGKHAEYEPAA